MHPDFLIIVEGCDKCGKTSLVDALAKRLGWPAVHFGRPKGNPAAEYMRFLSDHDGPAVLDRFHLGESVYGPIYRKTPPLSDGAFLAIELMLTYRGALLVLLNDGPESVARRFESMGEDFARVEDVKKIMREYVRQFYRSRLPKLHATWAAPDLLVPTLVSVVDEMRRPR